MRYQSGLAVKIDWDKAYDHVLSEAQWRHKGAIKVLAKNATWYWNAFHLLMSTLHLLFTLARSPWHYSSYNMTLGRYLFLAQDYKQSSTNVSRSKFYTLRHEVAHFDHMYFDDPRLGEELNRWEVRTRGSKLSMLKNGLMYLWGTPLPFRYAEFRAEVEYWGYLQNVRIAVLENGGTCPAYLLDRILHQFTGPGYGWMCTKKKGQELVSRMVLTAEKEWLDGILHMRIFGAGTRLSDFVLK